MYMKNTVSKEMKLKQQPTHINVTTQSRVTRTPHIGSHEARMSARDLKAAGYELPTRNASNEGSRQSAAVGRQEKQIRHGSVSRFNAHEDNKPIQQSQSTQALVTSRAEQSAAFENQLNSKGATYSTKRQSYRRKMYKTSFSKSDRKTKQSLGEEGASPDAQQSVNVRLQIFKEET